MWPWIGTSYLREGLERKRGKVWGGLGLNYMGKGGEGAPVAAGRALAVDDGTMEEVKAA